MARRRRAQLGEDNHERWLVSYADFITLLFAFFVVMYSISSVNEGKYRILSSTLNEVFGQESVQSQDAPDAATPAVEVPPGELLMPGDQADYADPMQQQLQARVREAIQKAASQQRVMDELQISLQDHLDRGDIKLRQDGDRIEIEMSAGMLFKSGDARLSSTALDVLRAVSQSLVPIPNPVQVEGHTDNVPISSFLYPSNWELSAARAASVVHFLSGQGIAPQRLAAVGMGEHRPVASNDTPTGRARNRRVTLMILGAKPELFAPEDIVPWAEGPAVDQP